jgi:hypothetical protein
MTATPHLSYEGHGRSRDGPVILAAFREPADASCECRENLTEKLTFHTLV